MRRSTRWLRSTGRGREDDARALADAVPKGPNGTDERGRESLSEELLQNASRRETLQWAALAGAGVLGGLVAGRMLGSAAAGPGDAISGTTISNTDIDAKRIASVRIATEFAPSKHLGTVADPWPGNAIQAALDDLPPDGGIAFVPPGVYNVSVPLRINRSNLVLSGAGSASRLRTDGSGFTTNVSGMIEVVGALTGVTVERLSLDGTNTDTCRGVLVTGGAEALIQVCEISNFMGVLSQRGRGISIGQNPSTPPFKECVVSSCTLRGNQIGIVVHRTRFSFLGNRCLGNAWDGIYLDGIEAQGSITGNVVAGNARAGLLAVAGQRVTVSNNSFFDNSANIDLNDSGRMTVMGNIIEGARASGGIYMVNPNTKFNMIIGNWIFGQRASADSNGIYLYNGPTQNVIAGNACSEISRNGIALLNGANDNRVEGNLCFNNSVGSSGWAGVRISNAFDNVIRGNRCFDDQVTKTQAYGIVEANGADRNAIVDNDLRGNATAGLLLLGANTVVRRNIGHVTERRGVATIPAGQSSTTVSHGLVTTPGLVTLGPRDREVASAFVSARDATSFTITSLSPTTGDRQIDWYAEV